MKPRNMTCHLQSFMVHFLFLQRFGSWQQLPQYCELPPKRVRQVVGAGPFKLLSLVHQRSRTLPFFLMDDPTQPNPFTHLAEET